MLWIGGRNLGLDLLNILRQSVFASAFYHVSAVIVDEHVHFVHFVSSFQQAWITIHEVDIAAVIIHLNLCLSVSAQCTDVANSSTA